MPQRRVPIDAATSSPLPDLVAPCAARFEQEAERLPIEKPRYFLLAPRENSRPLPKHTTDDQAPPRFTLPAILQRTKTIVRAALRPIPLDAWQRLFPRDIIALCYHVVSDERLDHVRLYPYKNVAQFANDVAFVRERAVSYRQVADYRRREGTLPPNSVLITFDDGFSECYEVVRPILLRSGVDAVFFVTTDFIDDNLPFVACALSLCITAIEQMTLVQARGAIAAARINADPAASSRNRLARAADRLQRSTAASNQPPEKQRLLMWILDFDPEDRTGIGRACNVLGVNPREYSSRRRVFMSSAQIQQLAADGFTIGAHGLNHRRLEGWSAADIENEIVASCTRIRDLTGQFRVPFAFPYNGRKIDRRIVADIVGRHADLIDLIFDSGNLRRDRHFIVNRVFADDPSNGGETNLPRVLQDAWAMPTAWWFNGKPHARATSR